MSDPAADPVVSISSLTVLYGKQRALNDVTASFPRGAVGLLGPNGAGKSTLLKTLLGFIKPAAGAMKVLTAFETGLGRPIIWSSGRRLVLVPHAPVDSNAHFDPGVGAVLCPAPGPGPGGFCRRPRGSVVFFLPV